MKFDWHVSIVILVAFLSGPKAATAQFYTLTKYADENGLPSRIVRGSYQDKDGFLWVCGNNGLYKFDGKTFTSYYAALKDTSGLRGNKINAVIESDHQQLYIATDKGLHVMRGDSISHIKLFEKSIKNRQSITSLFKDAEENIWAGTFDGLFIIDRSRSQIRYISHLQETAKTGLPIWGFTQDKSGRIWIGSNRGFGLYQGEEDYVFKPLHHRLGNGLRIQDVNVFRAIEYGDNQYLVESNKGLINGRLLNDSTFYMELFLDAQGAPISNHFIYHTIVDSDKNIWAATWNNKVEKYRIENGQLVKQPIIVHGGLSDMANHAISIYEDKNKNIWVSSANGLYRLTKDEGRIFTFPSSDPMDCFGEKFSVRAIMQDQIGHLWVATGQGIYRFKKGDVLNRICPTDFLFIQNKHFKSIASLLIDQQNRLWVGANGGLSIAQLDQFGNPGDFTSYSEENGLPHDWTTDIYQQNDSTFWFGNYVGLFKASILNEDIRNLNFKHYKPDGDRKDALVNSWVFDIETDGEGSMWFGTYSGLGQMTSEGGQGVFRNFNNEFGDYRSLSNNSIKRVFKDSGDRLWVGTQTGLNLFREETQDFIQFGRKDGMPSEYVLGLAEDSKQNLWMATTNGLLKSRFDEANLELIEHQYFTKINGLADNISNKNAFLIDDADNLYIGSSKGLSVFRGNQEEQVNQPFNLALTSLATTQKKKQGFVERSSQNDQEIDLAYDENSIQLSYSVLDLSKPEFNRYRHKVLPINLDWVETGAHSELSYYNLSPGEYEIILDGSNYLGQWSQHPIHLKINIAQPFWKSKLALLLYTLLILGAIRFFYKNRIQKRIDELEHESKMEKALVAEREQLRNENAADFHDELGSKVTKISLFLTLAERSLQNKQDPSNWFAKIRENTKDLSGSFRDLLWVIDPKKDSLNDTFLRLKDFGEELFNNTQIDFRTSGFSMDKAELLLDPQTKKHVVLIFKEAMNNCAKYAECDRVILKLSVNGSAADIELSDNGRGFNVQIQSKGRGLKNMLNRASKIGSELRIDSNGHGTSILLRKIPHMSDDSQNEVT